MPENSIRSYVFGIRVRAARILGFEIPIWNSVLDLPIRIAVLNCPKLTVRNSGFESAIRISMLDIHIRKLVFDITSFTVRIR